jgi:hypothetical protein
MSRRLTGAALNARVAANCRQVLAEDYGLPMSDYDVSDVDSYSIGSDMQPILEVTFKHRKTGCEVQVTSIHPTDDGSLGTYGSNYGKLAY